MAKVWFNSGRGKRKNKWKSGESRRVPGTVSKWDGEKSLPDGKPQINGLPRKVWHACTHSDTAMPCLPFLGGRALLLVGVFLERRHNVRSHVGKEAKKGRTNNSEHVGGGNRQCRDYEERCDQEECEGYDVQDLSGGVLQCLAFRLGEISSPSLCFNSIGDPAGMQALRQDSTKNF